MKRVLAITTAIVLAALPPAAMANNVGENYAWQFQTTADKANQAAILDLIEKKKSGYYSPPITTYITSIDRQYNCTVGATATGNQGTNTNLANSPTTTGPSSSATGNDNQTS
ncbi:MAG: hypothetical protein PHE36_12815, partial [Novosphingobium sp.]|nr:hypothetical protein [Novosphingobium sp.]